MNLHSLSPMSSFSFLSPKSSICSFVRLPPPISTPFKEANYFSCSLSKPVKSDPSNAVNAEFRAPESLEPAKSCFCGRRHFAGAAALGSTLFPIRSSNADDSHSDSTTVIHKFRPPRPDWYEEFFASATNALTKAYEAEVARYKSEVFSKLSGKTHKILEIGIGTGPNLRYYASNSDVHVVAIDPNQKMEKYARSSAASAGLPPSNFEFIHAVGEAIPLSDASVDAVVGTLILCSVKDAEMTLKELKRVLRPGGLYVFVEHVAAKDGTFLRFMQRVLDPLQQTIGDGCHLCRETGDIISRAGFSTIELNTVFVSNATFVNPHIYGVAYK